MEGSSPLSFTGTRAETSYHSQVDDQYYAAADSGPQSFSDMNTGRPVSVSQDQPPTRTIDGDADMKRQPTFKDVAPDLGKSYQDQAVNAGINNRGPGGVMVDDEKPKTIGDLAAAHIHNSGTVGTSPYDQEVKIPTNSDMRPNNRSSGYQEGGGGYQYMSGPKSYNGDNFGKFTW